MNASGSSRGPFAQSSSPPRANAATSGTSRATRVAGGSITVSEPRSVARAAASSATTPPYEWPTRWSPSARRSATQSACSSKSTRAPAQCLSDPSAAVRLVEPGPLEHDELGGVADPAALLAPGRAPADEASVDEHQTRARHVTNLADFRSVIWNLAVTSSVVCSGRMAAAAPSSPHSLATASGLLLGTTAASIGVGALIGWLLGSAGIGLLIGAIVGIPLSIFVVYKVYSQQGA